MRSRSPLSRRESGTPAFGFATLYGVPDLLIATVCSDVLDGSSRTMVWAVVAVAIGLPLGLRMAADYAASEYGPPTVGNWVALAVCMSIGLGCLWYLAAEPVERCQDTYAEIAFSVIPAGFVGLFVALISLAGRRLARGGDDRA